MSTIELNVEGMSCGSCVKHVTEALNTVEGVTKVDVDLQAARVRVSGQSDSQVLIASLTDAGYPAQLASPAAGTNNMKRRVAVAAVAAAATENERQTRFLYV